MIVNYEKLLDMTEKAFAAAGFSPENAAQMAEVLVTAEARGVYSHGLQLVPVYFNSARNGFIQPNPEVRVLHETESSLVVDGGYGLGGIVLTKATDLALAKCKKSGSCSLSVINSAHYGAGAYYVERAARAGTIAYLYANTEKSAAPFGGCERYLGTNPYSFAAPAGKYGNIVLDMATTETAASKLIAAANDGKQVKLGMGVDANGNPTTDPNAILNGGCLSHFGGVKGYGIAFMIAVVSGVLSGSAYLKDDICLFGTETKKPSLSFFMNLTDIEKFIPLDSFQARAEDLIDDIKRVTPAPGFSGVCHPGEIENRNYKNALENGVNVHDACYQNFIKAAADVGVTF